MVFGLYRRHGLQFFRYEGVRRGFDACFLMVEEAEIIIQERNEPDLVLDFLDADDLSSEDLAQADSAFADADPSTMCDPNRPIMKRIVWLGWWVVETETFVYWLTPFPGHLGAS
jgi:hypothetical protein